MQSTAAALRAVLSPSSGDTGPIALDASSWGLLLEIARVERLLGLVEDARTRGSILLTTEQAAILHAELSDVALADLRRARVIADVADAWKGADVDFRAIKGVAAAAQLYGSTSARDTGDFDVAVPSKDLERAMAVLEAHGYQLAHPFRGDTHRTVCRSITTRHRVGVEVDVHRRYGSGRRYEHDPVLSPFYRPRVTTVYYGVELPTVGLVDLLIAAVAHASRGAGLSTVADLLRLGGVLRGAGLEGQAMDVVTRLPRGCRSAATRLVAPWWDEGDVEPPWMWHPTGFGVPAAALLRSASASKFSEVGVCSPRRVARYLAEFVWPTAAWRQYRSDSRAVTSAERRWAGLIDSLAKA